MVGSKIVDIWELEVNVVITATIYIYFVFSSLVDLLLHDTVQDYLHFSIRELGFGKHTRCKQYHYELDDKHALRFNNIATSFDNNLLGQ